MKKKTGKKSQVAIEFYIMMICLLFIFIMFLKPINDRKLELNLKEIELEAKTISDIVAYNINQISLLGDGSSTTIFIPDYLSSDTSFNLSTTSNLNAVEILWQSRRYSSTLITKNISSYMLQPGELNITNKGGEIVLTQ